MQHWPKISIITPSYNQGQYIEETILSVINQGYPNLEYIIIDGGSNDNTVAIIRKYEKHISYWVSEPDQGQSHAINKGLSVATGEVFNWLNSDDLLTDDSLFAIGKHFKDSQINVLCGYCNQFDDASGKVVYAYQMGIRDSAEETILHHGMNQPATFFRMAVVRELGGINEELRYVMDLELWIRYLLRFGLNNIQTVDTTLAHFRLHVESKSVGQVSKMEIEENNLYYSLAVQCKLPEPVLEDFTRGDKVNNQKKKVSILLSEKENLGLKKLNLLLCLLYIKKFYKKGKYTGSKVALIYYLKNAKPKLNKYWVLLIAQAFLGDLKILQLYSAIKRRIKINE